MKKILISGKQIIIFIACAVVFSSVAASALFKEKMTTPLQFLSDASFAVNIVRQTDDSFVGTPYSGLYSLFEKYSGITVIKYYKGGTLNGLQIYSSDENFSLPSKYCTENEMFRESSSIAVLEKNSVAFSNKNADGSKYIMLGNAKHEIRSAYRTFVNDYNFISNLYSFSESDILINTETLYVDGVNSDLFMNDLEKSLNGIGGIYEISIGKNTADNSDLEVSSDDLFIIAGAALMIVIVCFGSVIYIKLMLNKKRKEFYCKFICGADLTVIRRELDIEFAANISVGAVLGAILSLVMKI